MTKTTGFKIKIEAFLPIDRTSFAKQAAAYQMMDALQTSGKFTQELINSLVITGLVAKVGSADIPDAPDQGDNSLNDPANIPLTTDPLPEGAIVLEAAEALDNTVVMTVRLVDGTEVGRRVSADQYAAETKEPVTEMEGGKVTKRGYKPASE